MSPLCATGEYDAPGQIIEGQGSYLSLMMLSQLPDGQVLTPTVSGDGSVMVHGVLGDDGSLALVIVDLRDPAEAEPVPVKISEPHGLLAKTSTSWQLINASTLSSRALKSPASMLSQPTTANSTPLRKTYADSTKFTLASEPGSVLLLKFVQNID